MQDIEQEILTSQLSTVYYHRTSHISSIIYISLPLILCLLTFLQLNILPRKTYGTQHATACGVNRNSYMCQLVAAFPALLRNEDQ